MDCEGCEWSLTQKIIGKCPEWIIEVHGRLGKFLEKIPVEYKVNLIRIKKYSELGETVAVVHLSKVEQITD